VHALWLACLLLLPLPAPAQETQDTLKALMQQLASQGEVYIAGETVYDLPVTQQIYADNAYTMAWTNPVALNELAAAIYQAEAEGMNPADYHQVQVQGLLDGSLALEGAARDLLLTDSLVRLTYHYAYGKVDPKTYVSSWNFDLKLPQVDPVHWARGVISNGGILTGINRLKPTSPMYGQLVQALAQYRAIAAAGGWATIDPGPTLHPGESGPRITQIRHRLLAEGDLAEGTSPDPNLFDETLKQAVIRFQRRHHLDADGVVGKQTWGAMNVPVQQRIGQIRVNLERARVLQDIPATAVVVDIAGYEVSLFRDGQQLLRTRAQVGRPYRSTPTFRDEITYIEFNPTWTVPPSILKHDTLPEIRRDPGYLQRKNMQVLTRDGTVVDPASVNWQLYPARGFPYILRQQPGPNNSLGRLKIMFPNEHMVYLHDTPSRDLFRRSERTFSSGCIRVEEVLELAELLLDDPAWDQAAIANIIGEGKTRRVSLRQPMPIYLVYWTVQVQDDGAVHFKRDPYQRDDAMIDVLSRPLKPDPARLVQYQPRG
jgi:murein L,D-transpeptidase YcbB/YkuD